MWGANALFDSLNGRQVQTGFLGHALKGPFPAESVSLYRL